MKKVFGVTTLSVFLFIGLIAVMPQPASASIFDSKQGVPLGKGDVNANADTLTFVGTNIIAKGNVEIRYKDMIINGDKAIVNVASKSIEAVGHITFTQVMEENKTVSLDEFIKMRKDPDLRVILLGYKTTPVGSRELKVRIIRDAKMFKADRVTGSLSTGIIFFQNFRARIDAYFVMGKDAVRAPDGVITVKDVKLTTCEYILDDHEHYSIRASKIKIFPTEEAMGSGDFASYNTASREHSIWAYNCRFEVFGLPIIWTPMLYKPPGEDLSLVSFKAGESTEWGYFLQLSKSFRLMDYPYIRTRFYLDFFSRRGVGYGNMTNMVTDESYTEFFAYGIYDKDPYTVDSGRDALYKRTNDRLKIPNWRWDIRLSNITHITPRLDFRGHIEALSDYQFLSDYFNTRYNSEPQPITFGALEYQFDRFSASLLVRPRMNDFFTTVEKLPEFRLDFPRQELMYNLYYQGQTSAAYMKMNWRNWDNPRTSGNLVDPKDYESFRLDTLHMFYFPFQLFNVVNVIPRAGFRFTAYSKSSKLGISTEDLGNMFIVDDDINQSSLDVVNYDDNGGGKARFVGEFGVEANTKFYATWNNVKNSFWELDGLRHVMVPYVNYNYIPEPTVSRDHLYYFDDIDRIDRQNFVRVGLKNRLQTRRGNFGGEQIYDWMTIENYIDYHFVGQKSFSKLGFFGTILNFNPFPGLNVKSELLLDVGQSNEQPDTIRNNQNIDRKGISNKWIDKWETTISYQILDDLKIYGSYNYHDAYAERSAYSMGSTLTDIVSGTDFFRGEAERYQVITVGAEFPIPIDDKTFGAVEMQYDVEEGYIREKRMKIIRSLHCWEAALEFGQSISRKSDGAKENDNFVMFSLYLTALPGVVIGDRSGLGGGISPGTGAN